MHPHPDVMGQVAEGEQIMGLVERHPFREAQAFACHDLFGDRQQRGVIDL